MSARLFQAAGAASIFLSVGHTLTAGTWMNNPSFQKLPLLPRMKARAGWYQGSVFLFIVGLQNLRWAEMYPAGGPLSSLEVVMASLAAIIYGATAGWYALNQDVPTSVPLAVTAALQLYAALSS